MSETTATAQPDQVLVYVHDPMCSWCYGFAPTWDALKAQLPRELAVVSILGGLAPDSDTPMASEMAMHLRATWERIASVCGVSFNLSYWDQDPLPPRTTWIACRAVIAAERVAGQGEDFIQRIQTAYYQHAQNVWDPEVLVSLAVEAGFREDAFREALNAEETVALHHEQMELAARLQVEGYPSLLLIADGEGYPIAIRHNDPDGMVQEILDLLAEPND